VPAQFPADPDVLTGLVHQAFPKASSVSIRRASGGRVVVVYRAMVDDVKYYLRLAEEPGEDLTTDALVLERLRALGVRVPGVVAASPSTAAFPRSWMIMTEVPGCSIAQDGTDDEARQAAMAAGRDVAVINSVPVAGFGWLQRDGSGQLTAELPSYREFAGSYLPSPWPGRLSELFDQRQLDVLHALAAAEKSRPLLGGQLAHGDLDVTHIYAHAGRYSGIIDFGEMRGADVHFDLGHFLPARGLNPARITLQLVPERLPPGQSADRRLPRGNPHLSEPSWSSPALALAQPGARLFAEQTARSGQGRGIG
jgi:aminoglycoside phosphotransferase (APT) family kinase protein